MNNQLIGAPEIFAISKYSNTSGSTIQQSSIINLTNGIGIAMGDIANSTTGPIATAGVFKLTAVNGEVWVAGVTPLYYNTTTAKITIEPGGNVPVGVAWEAKASAATTGRVLVLPVGIGIAGGTAIRSYSTGSLVRAAFTDGGAAAGTLVTGLTIPEGFRILGRMLKVTTAFIGDTSAVIEVGWAADPDGFGPATDQSVFTVDELYADSMQGEPIATVDRLVQVVVTSAADFTNVSAGAVEVIFWGIQLT